MADESYEFEGKSVDEAIANGLSQLNLAEDQVSVEILSKGSRGILGFGSEPARVRMTLRPTPSTVIPELDETPPSTTEAVAPPSLAAETPVVAASEGEAATAIDDTLPVGEPAPEIDVAPPVAEATAPADVHPDVAGKPETLDAEEEGPDDEELADLATEMLSQMIELMGFDAQIEAEWRDPDEQGNSRYLRLDIQGEDLGVLIGRRGETLASLQYLLRLMVNQRLRQWKNIVVDVEQYKERRIVQLSQLAQRMAEQVAESGRAVSLEPMPAGERRIVHIALRDHPDVYTASIGEDERRKVEIIPKDQVS